MRTSPPLYSYLHRNTFLFFPEPLTYLSNKRVFWIVHHTMWTQFKSDLIHMCKLLPCAPLSLASKRCQAAAGAALEAGGHNAAAEPWTPVLSSLAPLSAADSVPFPFASQETWVMHWAETSAKKILAVLVQCKRCKLPSAWIVAMDYNCKCTSLHK